MSHVVIHGHNASKEAKKINLAVGEFVAIICPALRSYRDFGPYQSLGFIKDDELVAGAVFHRYTGFDVKISLGGTSPKWATKENLGVIADFVFNRLNCVRMTAFTAKNNKKARKLLEGSGFKLEGVQRMAFDGFYDACLYGMIKNECRWL